MKMPHRIKIKYFVQEPEHVDLPAFIPIFHQWIQNQSGDDLLIDVADYKHVPNGPGILLMGHQADYALDMEQGRPGLMYQRKRLNDSDNIQTELGQMLRQILQRCQWLEDENSFAHPIRFHTNELELTFSDRLNTPNQAQHYDQLQSLVQPLLDEVYGAGTAQIEQANNDPRHPLTLHITAPSAPDLNILLQR